MNLRFLCIGAFAVSMFIFFPSVEAADHLISQKNKVFDKTTIKIKAGDTVSFRNDEADLSHNVYSLGPKNEFELKSQAPGQKSTVTFKAKGKTEVECAIHPTMKLIVETE